MNLGKLCGAWSGLLAVLVTMGLMAFGASGASAQGPPPPGGDFYISEYDDPYSFSFDPTNGTTYGGHPASNTDFSFVALPGGQKIQWRVSTLLSGTYYNLVYSSLNDTYNQAWQTAVNNTGFTSISGTFTVIPEGDNLSCGPNASDITGDVPGGNWNTSAESCYLKVRVVKNSDGSTQYDGQFWSESGGMTNPY